MTQIALIARLGNQDTGPVPPPAGYVAVDVNLIASRRRLLSGLGEVLGDLPDVGAYPTEIGADILLLAATVFAADTRISRARTSQDSWSREIAINVPVSDPHRWDGTRGLLERTLNFLTGDRWQVGFRSRPTGIEELAPRRPVTYDGNVPFSSVCLFSGGMDSFIGAVDLLEVGETPLFVSHAGEGPTNTAQRGCFTALQRHYQPRPIERLRVWLNFPADLVPGSAAEDTTRGRSFLFFGIAAAVATSFPGGTRVYVPENGLISLNVPLDVLRLGSLSTRTTHPFYMARWNELLAALGVGVEMFNPYRYATKGEMAAQCRNGVVLQENLPFTLSCSAPAKGRYQRRRAGHCGYCVPCIIRRASIVSAFGEDRTPYAIADLAAQRLDARSGQGRQIRSFQLAAQRLAANPALAPLLIHKPGPLGDDAANLSKLAEVYRRGMGEVHSLLRNVVTVAE